MKLKSPLTVSLGCLLAGAIFAGVCNWAVLVGSKTTEEIRAGALEFEHVELGSLAPNQAKPFSVTLRNRCSGVLKLLPPEVSCGCIAAAKEPIAVEPGAQIAVRFTYRANSYPGLVDRKIVFAYAANPALTWTVKIAGEVVADVWAEPSEILIIYEDGDLPNGELTLHHRVVPEVMDTAVMEAVSDNPALLVEPTHSAVNVQRFSISVSGDRAPDEGACNVRLLGKDGSTVLVVPVRWRKKPPLLCYPRALRLTRGGVPAESNYSRRLVISRGTKIHGRVIDIKALVPWLRIAKTQDTGRAVVADLQLDPNTIPANFDDTVLKISAGGEEPILYRAHISEQSHAR